MNMDSNETSSNTKYGNSSDESVSDRDLKHAYLLAATIVTELGDTYLPIFERLEVEYQARQAKKQALERAKTLALKFNG